MAFMFMPNGVRPDHWTPAGEAENYEITPHLKPLEAFKNDFLLLENLWNKNTVGRNGHWPKVPAWLSGGYVERTSGDDLDTGGDPSISSRRSTSATAPPLPSFRTRPRTRRAPASTRPAAASRGMYGSFLSWRDPHTPVPKEIVPQLAFRPALPQQPRAGGFEHRTRTIPSVFRRCSATTRACSTW